MTIQILSVLAFASAAHAFVPTHHRANAFRPRLSSTAILDADVATPVTEDASYSVRAPMKYLGPYPAIGLRFPYLSTAAMKERNATGISLDFILDTAANTNTLNLQVAKELGLPVVGQASPGLSAAGAMEGAETFMLGDSQLGGLGEEIFMQNLTASGLPNPAAAGLLSKAFLDCFQGGVEFEWGSMTTPPSVTFHDTRRDTTGMVLVPMTPLPITLLPTFVVRINGIDMVALLDTGSPITVMNAAAAKVAGVAGTPTVPEKTNNPFSNMVNNFNAAARGDVVFLAGVHGERIQLVKSAGKVPVSLADGAVDFGSGQIYIGDIPGLVAMNSILGLDAPACVLGMDVLRTKPKMLYCGQDNQVYF
jgi:Aspartyl protease